MKKLSKSQLKPIVLKAMKKHKGAMCTFVVRNAVNADLKKAGSEFVVDTPRIRRVLNFLLQEKLVRNVHGHELQLSWELV